MFIQNVFKLAYNQKIHMKYTNTFFIVFLLLIQTIAIAQPNLSKDFKTTVGTPFEVVDGPSKEYFSDGKGFTISVKTQGEKVTIQRFDVASMKEVKRNAYEDFPPYNKIAKVIQTGDKLFYIFSSFNKKEKKDEVYAREINMSDATFKPAKLLFTTGSEVIISGYLEGGTSIFDMIGIRFEAYSSFDNTKLLVRYRTKPLKKKDSENFDVLGFYVFNTNTLDKIWGGEVAMPYTEKQMNNLAYSVSKDGSAYSLIYLRESKTFELLTIKPDLSVKVNKIALDANLYFQEFKLRESAEGNLSATGYYANGLDVVVNWTGSAAASFNTNGILQFKMAPDGKIIEKYTFEFPLELINQYESKRVKDKNAKREGEGKAGISDLKMTSLTLNEDGSTTVIGEQQYIRNEFVGTQQKQVYYYGDVIATKFDKKGTLLWQKKLPKTQVGFAGKGGMGIRYIKGKNTNYVLYLDNVKNASISMDEVPEKHQDGRGGFLTAYKLDDATGAVTKHTLFDITNINGTEAFQFKTPRIFNVSDTAFLLEIYLKGKQDAMVKMELSK
jgi:hypothetical protein